MNLPPKVAAAFEHLRRPQPDAPQGGPDLRWARRIVERHRRGEAVKSATLQMAREALAGRPIHQQQDDEGSRAD